jgi:membrane-bound lytic murein transglycosylase D
MNPTLQSALESRVLPWVLLSVTLAFGSLFVLSTRPHEESARAPELQALSASVHARGLDYSKGLELIVAGDAVMGRNLIDSATNRMALLAQECMGLDGCDITLFVDALGAALDTQRVAIANARRAALSPASEADAPDEGPLPPAHVVETVADPGASTALPQMDRAVSLLQGVDFRELIILNGAVKSALNDWLTWNRPQLVDAYENYLFLREDTAPIYRKAQLPEALLFALMAQETGAKVHSYSRAGAAGPLQFMPRTGQRYGLVHVGGFDMRLDPVASTKASAEYLNTQLERFNNDLEKALAAYNGGETRLGTLHRKLQGASFWDPELYYAVPAETRNYVPGVLAAAWIFLHREDYGLEFPDLELGTTTIVLKEDISIGELTVCLGQRRNRNGWFRTLRNLNPRLKGNERIEAGEKMRVPSMVVPAYVERCSGDSPLLARARELHEAGYEGSGAAVAYTVKKGDTLVSIAERFGCKSVSKVAKLNDVKAPDYAISVGQQLSVPRCS